MTLLSGILRRKDKEIKKHDEIDDILKNALIGRLGTCLNNVPYVTPVNFVYDEGNIFLHSAIEGRKITNIISNPKVCFEIDEVKSIIPRQPPCASTTEYKSIIIFGNAKIVTDDVNKVYALNKLIEKYAPQSSKISLPNGIIKMTTIIEVNIEEITAKQSPGYKRTAKKFAKKD